MSAIVAVLTSDWGQRLGWMLVHSLWELGLIALAYSLVLALLPRAAATVRYAAGCVALLCMILTLPVTLACIDQNPLPLRIAKNEPAAFDVTLTPERSAKQENSTPLKPSDDSFKLHGADFLNRGVNPPAKLDGTISWHGMIIPLLPWLTALWFVGVILFSLRLLIGLAAVERLRRVGVASVAPEIAAVGASLEKRLALRQAVKFAESALVQVPTVIGYLRPLVLLPAVPVTGLSIQEIEFLVAHELAHIRRHDYLHNLVQGVIETLLFYHPAMWWVSSCVRRERENCCDDLVVATLEHRAEYARTLFALEQRRTTWSPSLAATDGRLLQRICRLIGRPADSSLGRQWGKGLAGLIVLLLLSVPFAAAVLSLAAQREVVAAAENKKARDAGTVDNATRKESNSAPAVRVVVGPNKTLTFEGEETNWDGVEAKLQKVPAREKTILEVAIATEDVSVREMNNAIGTASHYGRQFGFKYTSYIGVHPLGSKGTRPEVTSAATKPSDQPNGGHANKADNCILKLPDGSSVEFVGISPHPAKGQTWWSPNGTPLEKAPWPSGGGELKGGDRLYRQFAFRFHGSGKNVDIGHWSFHSNGATGGALVGAFDSVGKTVPGALVIASSFDNGAKEATISVGVAARPRRFALSVDAKGNKIVGGNDWLDGPTKVRVDKHDEQGGFDRIQTFFGVDRADIFDFDLEVVAIDVDGNKNYASGLPIYHQDKSSNKSATQPYRTSEWGFGFSIPLSQVKEFRILARSNKSDYNWFTFKNVSLQAGHHTNPMAHVDQFVAEGAKSQHLAFKPRHGMAGDTSWTELFVSRMPGDKSLERLMANVSLEGEFPVTRRGDKKPLFKVKLMAGSDESLNVKLTDSNGIAYNRILHRGKPLSWKLNGKTYELLYPQTNAALDTPAESPFASIIVTCRVEEDGGPSKSPKEKSKSDADSGDSKAVQPPDESLDDSKHDGGSDLLRNIRASAEPILAEMAQKHGYGLADGKVIRRVAPPYPELRMAYYRIGNPTQWEAIPAGPSSMAFRWIDGRLQNWGMTFGSDDDGYSVRDVIGVMIGIKAQGIDGPKELLAKRLPGDWVIRPGQSDEVVVQQLEKILQNELSIPVRLEFRKVDRDVYVARGDYKLTPLPGHPAEEKMFYTDSSETTDPVEIFGEQLVPNSGSGGGTGGFAEFLQWLGEWTEMRIVDEVGKHPSRNISWKLHGRSPASENMRRGDHDAELVLRNISKQTNLQFAKETRPVRVLSVAAIK